MSEPIAFSNSPFSEAKGAFPKTRVDAVSNAGHVSRVFAMSIVETNVVTSFGAFRASEERIGEVILGADVTAKRGNGF